MATPRKTAVARKSPTTAPATKAARKSVAPARDDIELHAQVEWALAALRKASRPAVRDGMARYGLPSDKALGVSVAHIQALGKQIGTHHALALALWDTDIYEARLLCAFIGDPKKLTAAQMDRWCRDFDNWGVVDTVCFKLFDRSPLAWAKARAWVRKREEFPRRAGFVLLACLAGHDKAASDAQFIEGLHWIEAGAGDERNFVRKGVSWALRRIGTRNAALKSAAKAVATRLSQSADAAPRWIGKDALRDFAKPPRAKKAGGD